MAITSGDFAAMVFKRAVNSGQDTYFLDNHMLGFLIEMDGNKNVLDIAKKLGLNMTTSRDVISNLLKLKLIERVENGISILDRDFFDFLNMELSLAIGPIAEVLIEDALVDLGHDAGQFPRHRAAELVDLIARQIQKEDRRTVFKQNMVRKISEKS